MQIGTAVSRGIDRRLPFRDTGNSFLLVGMAAIMPWD
ncbi:hypothetical protein DW661_00190 [Collinsella sp. AM24-1]|nr:hypothetical protein [Collinsella aerofaciens]RGJ85353.1 hypothetical protein DXD42_04640 [Collinsella sp. TM04-9]RGJ94633.1 hypothetical protein DXD39_00955 [Collinsella sp. TM04-29]RGT05891.1 hypothetical protein DWX55_03150 [Collinsella sp. AF19-7AC]RGT32808.1 hypothetical protein DWX39_02335 [Collinsella sp. AF19-1LB]RGU44368.1 hypothetical protein DWW73_02235 [Collinsella sp. AF16-8]RGW71705.1 hypothetical protein DWV58_01375 [Collinsella sp. AF11-11]RGX51623.1 hypothetical protein D